MRFFLAIFITLHVQSSLAESVTIEAAFGDSLGLSESVAATPLTSPTQDTGYDLRCDGLGTAFCQGQAGIKFYSFEDDPTFLKMKAELVARNVPLVGGVKDRYAVEYVSRLEGELLNRIGTTTGKLKADLDKLLTRLPEVWPGTPEEKGLVRAAVAKASILSLGELLTALWKDGEAENFIKFYTKMFVSTCNKENGPAVFSYNAFKLDNVNFITKAPIVPGLGDKLVIYCPAVILSAHQNSNDLTQLLDVLTFVLGHELTHIVDVTQKPQLYGQFPACIKKSYTFPLSEAALSLKELSADVGGIHLILDRFKGRTHVDTYQSLRKVLAPFLCLNKLPQSFSRKRLDVFGRNPEVIKALGCQGKTVPLCHQ